jgi:hypothetical protein
MKRLHILDHNFVTACQNATRIGALIANMFLNAHKKFIFIKQKMHSQLWPPHWTLSFRG